MHITQNSTHTSAIDWSLAEHARCRQACAAQLACRPVKHACESGNEANAAARRPLDFWAYIERENQRHPGTVTAPHDPPSTPSPPGAHDARDDRVISYAMPRLGTIPRTPGGDQPAPPPSCPKLTMGREVYTPIGTRIDILA